MQTFILCTYLPFLWLPTSVSTCQQTPGDIAEGPTPEHWQLLVLTKTEHHLSSQKTPLQKNDVSASGPTCFPLNHCQMTGTLPRSHCWCMTCDFHVPRLHILLQEPMKAETPSIFCYSKAIQGHKYIENYAIFIYVFLSVFFSVK